MTVAAIVVADTAAQALQDTAGRAALRRIVDAAWAGGALPIVVVADDPDGTTSAVLSGSPAVLLTPTGAGQQADYRAAAEAALEAVHETSACLLWPARMVWVDPETVTSLIEAHGRDQARFARPDFQGQPGWPVLIPGSRIASVLGSPSDLTSLLAGSEPEMAMLDLGDPGTVHGDDHAIDDLPVFSGPPEPVGGPPPEWGAAAAEDPEFDIRDDAHADR